MSPMFRGSRVRSVGAAVLCSLMLVLATAATATAAGNGTWTVSVANTSVAEGNSGSHNVTFTITYTHATGGTGSDSINWSTTPTGTNPATAGSSCTAGVDYVTNTGNWTHAVGSNGTHTVNVRICGDTTYEPDETFTFALSLGTGNLGTTHSIAETIANDDSLTTVASSSPSSTYGQAVTFTATVLPANATGGTVTFQSDGTTIAGASCTLTNGTCTSPNVTSLAVGSHQITAIWAGNTGGSPYGGSTSAAITQTVGKAASTTVVTAFPNPSTFGQTVTVTATVFPSVSDGTVTFTDPDGTLGTCTPTSGTCHISVSSLAVGNHAITATWGGDANYTGSASDGLLVQGVNVATTTTTVGSSNTSTIHGQSVTFTAHVTSSGGTPTGTVDFFDSAVLIGSCSLTSGSCSMSTTSLAAGSHTITASYLGNASFGASSSSPGVTQVVAAYGTTIDHLAFGVQPTDSFVGQPISPAVTVLVEDAYNNVIGNSNQTIYLVRRPNSAAGTLSGTTSLAAVNGVATFSDLSLSAADTGYYLRASTSSNGQDNQVSSNTFDVTTPLSLTFYKELCATYGAVPANANPQNNDDTGGHYNDLGPQESTLVYLPAACQPADGWQLNLLASQYATTPIALTPPTSGGVVTVALTPQEAALARSSGALWISEVTNPDDAGFGALRCTGDVLNGDNLEQLNSVGANVSDVYCVAYNVKQQITFDSIGSPNVLTPPITLLATSTSGLPVSFSFLSASGACSVSSGVLTILGTGTCSVTASQPGQSSIATGTPDFPFWSPAADVTQTFTIGKADQTITFPPLPDKTYGDAPIDLTGAATADSGLPVTYGVSGNCTLEADGVTVDLGNVGTCTVTASQGGNDTYNAAADVSQTFNIGKADATCTVNPYSTTYDGADHTATGSCIGVNDEVLSGLDLSGTTHKNAGTYAGDPWTFTDVTGNYNDTSGTVDDSIGKADQTITFPPLANHSYGDAPVDLTGAAGADSGLPITYSVSGNCTLEADGVTLDLGSVGTCSVTASQPGDGNYNAATPVTQTFGIGKLDQTITFVNPGTQTVLTPPFDLGATASSGLQVSYTVNKVLGISSSCTVSGSTLTITGAGFCSVTASQAGNDIYNPAPNVTRYFLISKLTQTITFDPLPDVVFGVAPITLDATASSGLPITYNAAGKCTVSGDTLTITGVGTCVVTARQPGDADYFAAIPVIRTFKIAKAPQTITFDPLADMTYGDGPITLTATASSGLPVSYVASGDCTVSGSTLTLTGAGSCSVTASQPGNANYYAAADVTQGFNIGPAGSTVTVTCPHSVVYTGSAQTPACTATASGPGMADVDVTGSIQFTNNIAVGTANVTASWAGDANHTGSDGATTFLILQAGSDVSIDCPSSVVYTGSAITPCSATATADGMDPITWSATDAGTGVELDYVNNVTVGTVTVTASWGGSDSYGGNGSSTTFTITPADLTITANDQTKAVGTTLDLGDTSFTPTGLLGSDQVNTVDLASTGADSGAAEGTYDITIGNAAGTGLGNYTIHYVDGTLTVTDKYVLTVTADDKSRGYGKANPSFTYNISGYHDGDDISAVTTLPTCTTTATTKSLPGTYKINCDGAAADSGKYVFQYVPGTLTITGQVVGGASGTPATTAASGGPVNSDSVPFFALLICIAFGGLGLLAVQAQRRSMRA